jgi:integrase
MARNRRFQDGQLIKRGKRKQVWVGRWWEDVIGSDGSRERVRRSEILGAVAEISTRRQARKLLSDRLRPINAGEYRPQATWTLQSFIQDRWLPEVLPTLKYSSKQHYEYITNHHLLPVFGDVQLRLISRDVVQSFLFAKLKSGLSWKTVKHVRTTLGTILQAAVMQDLIFDNPVRKTRFPRRGHVEEKAPISPEKLRALLAVLPEPSCSLVWLLALTGLRIGELLALRWQDVDFVTGVLRVCQSVYEGHFDEPKSRRGRRVIPMSAKCREVLESRKPAEVEASALVFATRNGTPLSRRNLLSRELKPACEKVGLKGANWHWLRHAFATLLDAVGTPLGTVQALLGHSSSEITREVYLHSIPADARSAVEKVEGLVIGPKWTQVAEEPATASTLIH